MARHFAARVIQVDTHSDQRDPLSGGAATTRGPCIARTFLQCGSIRDFITQKLIEGANATMAYVRSQRPQLVLRQPKVGAVLSQQHLDGTVDAARLMVERYQFQLMGPVLHVKDEPKDYGFCAWGQPPSVSLLPIRSVDCLYVCSPRV